ncbi:MULTISPECIES: hypothetical protein [Ramlibacter]|jgi:hypothetical protein|nr:MULTISPECIES: hypothetical protein [Ramlibacter]
MKLVLHTLIIFFGTLLAAGLVALGEPADQSAAPAMPQADTTAQR